jgi:hypothetical protein
MSRWPELKAAGLVDNWCADPHERRYWTGLFDQLHLGDREVWDLQWNFTCWSQNGLSVLPSANLVLNDGWGPDATHSKSPMDWPPTVELATINCPPFVVRNATADALTFERNFGGAQLRAMDSRRARLRRRISALLAPARTVKRAMQRLVARG